MSTIAVGSQPVALTTTTVRSAGPRPGRGDRLEGAERVAEVGDDADVAEPERGDPVDRRGVDVDGDERAAGRRVAGGGERELAGVARPEDADGPAVCRREVAGVRAGAVDVVELDRRSTRDVVGQRPPGRARET